MAAQNAATRSDEFLRAMNEDVTDMCKETPMNSGWIRHFLIQYCLSGTVIWTTLGVFPIGVVAQPLSPLLLSPPPVFSSLHVIRSFSLEEVRVMATGNHPAVQQAARQMEAVRGAWVQVGLWENPTVGYVVEDITQDSAGLPGVVVSQVIVSPRKLTARQVAVDKEYQIAKQTYFLQRQKVENDAVLAGYRIAFAKRKCQLLSELMRTAADSQAAGEAIFRAREISLADFLDLKIQAERTKMALNDAQIEFATAQKELAILLKLPLTDEIDITDSVDTIPPEINSAGLFTDVCATSPDIRIARAMVAAAQAKLRLECAEAGIDVETDMKIAHNNESGAKEYSVGIAIPLKIFNRNQGNIQRARAEVAAANQNLQRVEMLLAVRFETLYGEYQLARNRVISYERGILSEARESLSLSLHSYRQGEHSSLELLTSQRTMFTVQVEHLENLEKLMAKQVLLTGAMLTGGLDRPE